MQLYSFEKPKKPAGWWMIGQFQFPMMRRPRRLTRWLCRWLLEWQWRDEP